MEPKEREVRIWEATLQSEGLRQCRRERCFNVYGLLGRVLPGLEGQQAFFDGGEPLGGGGVGGFQEDHAGEVATGEGFDAAWDFALPVAQGFDGGAWAVVTAAMRSSAAASSSRAMVRMVSASSGGRGVWLAPLLSLDMASLLFAQRPLACGQGYPRDRRSRLPGRGRACPTPTARGPVAAFNPRARTERATTPATPLIVGFGAGAANPDGSAETNLGAAAMSGCATSSQKLLQ